MFVYLSFGLCLCRDGLYEFDLSKDEKSSFVCDGVSCPNMTGWQGGKIQLLTFGFPTWDRSASY